MSDILTITLSGRLTKDPELRTHNEKSFTTFSIACTSGYGDRAKTLFFNCTASGDAISKFFKKGDQIFITGEPTQNKKDKEVYHGVRVTGFTFGQKFFEFFQVSHFVFPDFQYGNIVPVFSDGVKEKFSEKAKSIVKKK